MNILKWFFGSKNEELPAEVEKYYYSKEKELRDAEYTKAKLEWELENNLKKKLDACYLHTQKTAFNGTYEEYLNERRNKNIGLLQQSAMAQQNSLIAHQLAGNLNNYTYRGFFG